MVEKLEVKLLLAALIAVMIRINANMPKAMIITVMLVRSLLDVIFFQDNARESR